ncbi:hypothetical protein D3C76_1515250 [compost metagenome]
MMQRSHCIVRMYRVMQPCFNRSLHLFVGRIRVTERCCNPLLTQPCNDFKCPFPFWCQRNLANQAGILFFPFCEP